MRRDILAIRPKRFPPYFRELSGFRHIKKFAETTTVLSCLCARCYVHRKMTLPSAARRRIFVFARVAQEESIAANVVLDQELSDFGNSPLYLSYSLPLLTMGL